MCDYEEGEYEEHGRYVEAAHARTPAAPRAEGGRPLPRLDRGEPPVAATA